MLAVQVQYWQLQEAKRHNRTTESIDWTNANENIRHNKANESIGWANYYETNRHNVASENIAYGNLYESIRHNKVMEKNDYIRASSQARLNNANAAHLEMQNAADAPYYDSQTRYNESLIGSAINMAGFAGNSVSPWMGMITRGRGKGSPTSTTTTTDTYSLPVTGGGRVTHREQTSSSIWG